MTFYLRLTFIILVLLAPCSFAQADNGEPLRISLSQAVSIALDNNADLALSHNRIQSAMIAVDAASGKFLPSLQGSASSSQNFRHQTAPGEPDSYRNTSLQLAANINLFNGFSDSAGLDASQKQQQAAETTLQRQQQQVAFTVASNYTTVLINQELVQVAGQNLESQQELQQQIKSFYEAGRRSITDYYQQQAATAQAEFNLADTQRNLQVSKLQLLQTLGRTLPVAVEVLPIDATLLDDKLGNLDATRTIEQALTSRPDLIAQQLNVEEARLQTRVARSGYLPNLDLQATTTTSYNDINHDAFSEQFDDNRAASIGLVLTIPIFDRDQTRTSVAQARISEADTITTKIKLQQQVGLEVGQAIADYQRAQLQLKSTGHQLEYSHQALNSSEARYQVGAATWVELSTARTNFIEAQGNEVRARYGLLLQGLNIGYARGDLDRLLLTLNEQESSL